MEGLGGKKGKQAKTAHTFFAAGGSESFPINYPQGTLWVWHSRASPHLTLDRCFCLLLLTLVWDPPSLEEWLSSSLSGWLLR